MNIKNEKRNRTLVKMILPIFLCLLSLGCTEMESQKTSSSFSSLEGKEDYLFNEEIDQNVGEDSEQVQPEITNPGEDENVETPITQCDHYMQNSPSSNGFTTGQQDVFCLTNRLVAMNGDTFIDSDALRDIITVDAQFSAKADIIFTGTNSISFEDPTIISSYLIAYDSRGVENLRLETVMGGTIDIRYAGQPTGLRTTYTFGNVSTNADNVTDILDELGVIRKTLCHLVKTQNRATTNRMCVDASEATYVSMGAGNHTYIVDSGLTTERSIIDNQGSNTLVIERVSDIREFEVIDQSIRFHLSSGGSVYVIPGQSFVFRIENLGDHSLSQLINFLRSLGIDESDPTEITSPGDDENVETPITQCDHYMQNSPSSNGFTTGQQDVFCLTNSLVAANGETFVDFDELRDIITVDAQFSAKADIIFTGTNSISFEDPTIISSYLIAYDSRGVENLRLETVMGGTIDIRYAGQPTGLRTTYTFGNVSSNAVNVDSTLDYLGIIRKTMCHLVKTQNKATTNRMCVDASEATYVSMGAGNHTYFVDSALTTDKSIVDNQGSNTLVIERASDINSFTVVEQSIRFNLTSGGSVSVIPGQAFKFQIYNFESKSFSEIQSVLRQLQITEESQ